MKNFYDFFLCKNGKELHKGYIYQVYPCQQQHGFTTNLHPEECDAG